MKSVRSWLQCISSCCQHVVHYVSNAYRKCFQCIQTVCATKYLKYMCRNLVWVGVQKINSCHSFDINFFLHLRRHFEESNNLLVINRKWYWKKMIHQIYSQCSFGAVWCQYPSHLTYMLQGVLVTSLHHSADT